METAILFGKILASLFSLVAVFSIRKKEDKNTGVLLALLGSLCCLAVIYSKPTAFLDWAILFPVSHASVALLAFWLGPLRERFFLLAKAVSPAVVWLPLIVSVLLWDLSTTQRFWLFIALWTVYLAAVWPFALRFIAPIGLLCVLNQYFSFLPDSALPLILSFYPVIWVVIVPLRWLYRPQLWNRLTYGVIATLVTMGAINSLANLDFHHGSKTLITNKQSELDSIAKKLTPKSGTAGNAVVTEEAVALYSRVLAEGLVPSRGPEPWFNNAAEGSPVSSSTTASPFTVRLLVESLMDGNGSIAAQTSNALLLPDSTKISITEVVSKAYSKANPGVSSESVLEFLATRDGKEAIKQLTIVAEGLDGRVKAWKYVHSVINGLIQIATLLVFWVSLLGAVAVLRLLIRQRFTFSEFVSRLDPFLKNRTIEHEHFSSAQSTRSKQIPAVMPSGDELSSFLQRPSLRFPLFSLEVHPVFSNGNDLLSLLPGSPDLDLPLLTVPSFVVSSDPVQVVVTTTETDGNVECIVNIAKHFSGRELHQKQLVITAAKTADGAVNLSNAAVKEGTTFVQIMADALGVAADLLEEDNNSNKEYIKKQIIVLGSKPQISVCTLDLQRQGSNLVSKVTVAENEAARDWLHKAQFQKHVATLNTGENSTYWQCAGQQFELFKEIDTDLTESGAATVKIRMKVAEQSSSGEFTLAFAPSLNLETAEIVNSEEFCEFIRRLLISKAVLSHRAAPLKLAAEDRGQRRTTWIVQAGEQKLIVLSLEADDSETRTALSLRINAEHFGEFLSACASEMLKNRQLPFGIHAKASRNCGQEDMWKIHITDRETQKEGPSSNSICEIPVRVSVQSEDSAITSSTSFELGDQAESQVGKHFVSKIQGRDKANCVLTISSTNDISKQIRFSIKTSDDESLADSDLMQLCGMLGNSNGAESESTLSTRLRGSLRTFLTGFIIETKQNGVGNSLGTAERVGINAIWRTVRSGQVQGTRDSMYQTLVSVCDELRDEPANNMEWVQYGAWLVPSIGFIGTIYGIGASLVSSGKMFEAEGAQQGVELNAVTKVLGTAFDTTAVALVLSIILVMFVHWVANETQNLALSVRDLLNQKIIELFRGRDNSGVASDID
jgi:biopolymer transport protein ExbB/TolQ